MKREEALDIVGMLAAHWPSNNWSVASIEAYARAIEPLDADVTTRAVLRAVQECEFYPRVSVLREFVRIEKRLSEPDGPIERMLNEKPSGLVPAWVKGWCCARYKHGDMRTWAEQDPEALPRDLMPSDERDLYISEGASLTIEQVFSTIGAA